MTLPLLLWLDRQGRIVASSPAVSELLEVPPGELVETAIDRWFPSADAPGLSWPELLMQSERTGQASIGFCRRRRGTQPICGHLQIVPLHGNAESARRYACSVSGEAGSTFDPAESAACQPQQLDAAARIAGTVAHEFDHLLTVV